MKRPYPRPGLNDLKVFFLLHGEMEKVVEALTLCRQTMRIIRQNLFWAFGYNLLALPLAVFAKVPPSLVALAMALSSLSVVLTALRLYRVPSRPRPRASEDFSRAS
jgi:cation transport ATPase